MTVRRYYTDSYTGTFSARVVELFATGERPAARLDETFFYPSSGGQPHDTGLLGGARVLDVQVRESDGEVLHLLDAPVVPGPVEGRIDWPRRFDHMQQHTGQHVLSQAFLRLAEAPTIGFHLGAETVTIDLGTAGLTDARVADAEPLANDVVRRNVPVRAWFPAADESGLVSVLRTERLKRGTRVEFICGERARTDYARKHSIVRGLSASLTCSPAELPDAVARLQRSLQETRGELAVLKERELDAEAARLLLSAESEPPQGLAGAALHGHLSVVTAAWLERPVEELKGLALRLTSQPCVVALLGMAGTRSEERMSE